MPKRDHHHGIISPPLNLTNTSMTVFPSYCYLSHWSVDRWLGCLRESLTQEKLHLITGAGYTGEQASNGSEFVTEDDRINACAELFRLQVGYHLSKETYFLALTYLDRFLSVRRVLSKHFRLVLCTCFLLAAKMQEESDRIPSAQDLAWACGKHIRVSDLKRMELKILIGLKWEMTSGSSLSYLYKYLEFLRMTDALTENEISIVLDSATKELFKLSAFTHIDTRGSETAYIALNTAVQGLLTRSTQVDTGLDELDIMIHEDVLPDRYRQMPAAREWCNPPIIVPEAKSVHNGQSSGNLQGHHQTNKAASVQTSSPSTTRNAFSGKLSGLDGSLKDRKRVSYLAAVLTQKGSRKRISGGSGYKLPDCVTSISPYSTPHSACVM
eukprot:CFRG5702T1